MLEGIRNWAKLLKRDVIALWIAARDPRTPWYAKLAAGAVAAYALSPIDLIPDFIPILGYLDDLLIVPLGVLLVVKLIPPALMQEYRTAATLQAEKPVSVAGFIFIGALWFTALALAVWWLGRWTGTFAHRWWG